MAADKIQAAIIGASGYTGADAIRLLATHPRVEIAALAGNTHAGKALADIFPQFMGLDVPLVQKVEDIRWEAIHVALCGLPHSTAQHVIKNIPEHVKIIDMSADFRFEDKQLYEQYYGRTHAAPALLAQAVYGISELNRAAIKKAHLVACAGCYPTAALLMLVPLLKTGLIEADDIIIDAKSGVTGAGRSLKEQNLFAEVAEGIHAYGVATHRHTPEIEKELAKLVKRDVQINFTPHLMPMNRGQLMSIYARSKDGKIASDMRAALQEFYADAAFIRLAKEGLVPATRHVRGSNFCLLNAFDDRIHGRVILFSVIDNLVKGSSGQAIQNMNLMFGFDETDGLQQQPLYP